MRVIFHGDDFGLTPGVNRGIIRAFKHGLLTSTSIMAVGEAAEEAMALALENPDLDVGIHLVLADEPPLLPTETLSTLISHHGLLPLPEPDFKGHCFPKTGLWTGGSGVVRPGGKSAEVRHRDQPPGQPPVSAPLSGTV